MSMEGTPKFRVKNRSISIIVFWLEKDKPNEIKALRLYVASFIL
jgi:hypothetical protein